MAAEENRALEALEAEKAYLLDELEMAYRQMEAVLEAADYERQVTYEELRRRNDELQRRLRELERAHAQLRETQHMLVRAERMSAMGEMASAIVHEINNPLAILAGQIELLMLEDEARRDHFEKMLEAVWRLRDLAQNVLSFARKSQAEIRPLDLNGVVGEVLDFFRPLTRRVLMEQELAEGLPRVLGHPSQLEQVLTNFLVNALDAVEERSERRVLLRTGRAGLEELLAGEAVLGWKTRLALGGEAGGQQRWVFAEVRDSGTGVEADLHAIFEAFFTTKGEDKGTGLGLAICRQIAEAHSGDILVATLAGEGTSFRLLLPPADEAPQ